MRTLEALKIVGGVADEESIFILDTPEKHLLLAIVLRAVMDATKDSTGVSNRQASREENKHRRDGKWFLGSSLCLGLLEEIASNPSEVHRALVAKLEDPTFDWGQLSRRRILPK